MITRSNRRSFRRFFVAGLAAALLGGTALAATNIAVAGVQPTRVADLVLLDAGFDAGLRQGMVCRVTRGGLEVAEVLLVDLRPAHSAALILNLAPRQAIRAGDSVRVKLLKT